MRTKNNLLLVLLLSLFLLGIVLAQFTDSRGVSVLLSILLFFGAVAILKFAHSAKESRKRLQQESNSLRAENQRFSIVYDSTTISMWDYDITKKEIHQDERSIKIHGFGPIIHNIPDSLIECGYVHPDYAEAYTDIYKKIQAGDKTVEGVVCVKKADGSGYWYERIRYSVLFDTYQRPYWAIGTSEDISERREQEMAYARWQKEINSKINDKSTVFGWNLTRDVVDGIERVSFQKMNDMDLDSGLNKLAEVYAERYVSPEDMQGLLSIVNRERLIGLYHDNVVSCGVDYRRLGEDGQYRWMQMRIQTVQYPDTGEIRAYISGRDIDKEKRQGLARQARAEQDSLTGAMNREAFENHVKRLLADSGSESSHSLIMMDIDGFKAVNDSFGHDAGDKLLEESIRTIRALLRHNDSIGRMGGDEFMICMKDIPYDAVIEKKARQFCEALRRKLSDEVVVSLSIGIAVFPRDGVSLEQLYKAADTALYITKENGKDGYTFYNPNMRNSLKPESNMPKTSFTGVLPESRMLIVDDDDYDREFLSDIFKDDFTVISSKNGESALSQLKRYGNSISIVLLDLDMPGMNGFEILAEMRGDNMLIDLPLIAISSDSSEECYLDAIAAGASDLLTKPVSGKLAKLKVQSAMTRIFNERHRAQKSYMRLQGAEDERYRRVLSATGTVVIIHDYNNNIYRYDSDISKHIAGKYDSRPMEKILLEDGVARPEDIDTIKGLEKSLIENPETDSVSHDLSLLIPNGERHMFGMHIIRMSGKYELTEKILITFNDINDAFEAEKELKQRAERDPLTGLYNRETFFEKAAELIDKQNPSSYIIAALDVNKFSSINEQYGQAAGDRVLNYLADYIKSAVSKVGGICCRISADNFACLYPNNENMADFIESKCQSMSKGIDVRSAISISVGRYIIDDRTLPVSAMYDRAVMAKKSIKGRYDVHSAYYDEKMREDYLREQIIVGSMEKALSERQFKVNLQPQYNHSSGAMIGAEALARWVHPTEGLIPPSAFIPIFEKNGFIYEMDQYIWEETCRLMRSWLDKGIELCPISVNVSRFDIYQANFIDVITSLLRKYSIPMKLLNLEITETAFSSAPRQIIDVVKRLVGLGFVVEIDDFGSGYSSRNTLKDVPAQVLKLDMRLLEDSEETGRGGSILSSVVRMSKWLNMPVIAEGVETVGQADFLDSIGCNYIQGFLYAKPMPADEFEALLQESRVEAEIESYRNVKTLDPNAFWDPKSMETLIFNSYVGGAAVAEYSNGEIEYLRINEKFIRELKVDATAEQILRVDPFDATKSKFRQIGIEAIERAIETDEEVEFDSAHKFKNSGTQWIRARVCVIGRSYERTLLYIAIENITNYKNNEQKIKETGEQLKTIMDTIESGVCAYAVKDYYPGYILFANKQYYSMLGYTEEQFNKEVKVIFDVFYPGEKRRVKKHTMEAMSSNGKLISYEYRVIKRDGSTAIFRGDSKTISVSGEKNPVLLVVTTDITDEREKQQRPALND